MTTEINPELLAKISEYLAFDTVEITFTEIAIIVTYKLGNTVVGSDVRELYRGLGVGDSLTISNLKGQLKLL